MVDIIWYIDVPFDQYIKNPSNYTSLQLITYIDDVNYKETTAQLSECFKTVNEVIAHLEENVQYDFRQVHLEEQKDYPQI